MSPARLGLLMAGRPWAFSPDLHQLLQGHAGWQGCRRQRREPTMLMPIMATISRLPRLDVHSRAAVPAGSKYPPRKQVKPTRSTTRPKERICLPKRRHCHKAEAHTIAITATERTGGKGGRCLAVVAQCRCALTRAVPGPGGRGSRTGRVLLYW